jgi:hypothetical protein
MTSKGKEIIIVGTSWLHCEFKVQRTHVAKDFNEDEENARCLWRTSQSSCRTLCVCIWAKVDTKGHQLTHKTRFRLYGTSPLSINQALIMWQASAQKLSPRMCIKHLVQFNVTVIAEQSFHVIRYAKSYLKQRHRWNHSFSLMKPISCNNLPLHTTRLNITSLFLNPYEEFSVTMFVTFPFRQTICCPLLCTHCLQLPLTRKQCCSQFGHF